MLIFFTAGTALILFAGGAHQQKNELSLGGASEIFSWPG
jgi:hypothetical protein